MNFENKLKLKIVLDDMLENICSIHPKISGKLIEVEDIVFEERTRINCFYCGKYNNNWRCPPRIPDINYQNMMKEFEGAALIYLSLEFSEKNYQEKRTDSSVFLHKALLECEKYMWNHNYPFAVSFIGGSCKLCKNGCGIEKCNNPYSARTPLEAIGINVVETARKYEIEVTFPPKVEIKRVGMLLW